MDLLDLAITAAEAAAGHIRSVERPAGPTAWTLKGRHDFVTDVDRAAEQIIADILLGGEPGSRILGEELSPDAAASDGLLWVVDPLDGTTNFLHGLPWYAVSIAAAVDGTLDAGVIINVPSAQRFEARRGGGAWHGERRLAVSAIADPAFALIGTGFPFRTLEELPRYLRQLDAVARATSGVRRAGSAALDLCDVACGRFEAFWELTLSPWDFAAAALIIREAGGTITAVGGSPLPLARSSVLAGTPTMHAWLDSMLARAARGDT